VFDRPDRLVCLGRGLTGPGCFELRAIRMMVWLFASASAAAAMHAGHWVAYTTGAAAISGFIIFGPVQEELLFRGAIFELAQRVFPEGRAFFNIAIATSVFDCEVTRNGKQTHFGGKNLLSGRNRQTVRGRFFATCSTRSQRRNNWSLPAKP